MNIAIVLSILVAAGVVVALIFLFSPPRGGFTKAVQTATEELQARGFSFPAQFNAEGAIKDLEIQWLDHFHMRDQTWRTLSNSALLFLGVIGLEVYKGAPHIVMIAGYTALFLISALGLTISMHHRYIQQKIKFPIIIRYEILLGLVPAFEDIVEKNSKRGPSTSTFIVVSHALLGIIAVLLLTMKTYYAVEVCAGEALSCLLDFAPSPDSPGPPILPALE